MCNETAMNKAAESSTPFILTWNNTPRYNVCMFLIICVMQGGAGLVWTPRLKTGLCTVVASCLLRWGFLFGHTISTIVNTQTYNTHRIKYFYRTSPISRAHSYPGSITLSFLPQLPKTFVQSRIFLLQNFYTNAVCLQLLLHVQNHISCTCYVQTSMQMLSLYRYSKKRH